MELRGIGLAGCGRMGAGMLQALIAAGFDAGGFDVRPRHQFGPLAEHIETDPRAFAGNLRTLLSVVRDRAQTEEVLFGAQNFTSIAPKLERIIICSTLSPAYVRALQSRVPKGITLIDAPMSGAEIGARERRLSFMLGGDAADLDALMPIFQAMGTSFHRMGGFGSGMAAKVLNNLLAASNTVMTRLVLEWARAGNLNPNRLLDLIAASSGQNWFASGFNEIEFSRDGFGPDNTIGILEKDVLAALDDAPEGADTRLPRLLVEMIGTLAPIDWDIRSGAKPTNGTDPL